MPPIPLRLPPLPAAQAQAIALLSNPDAAPSELAEAVSLDPSLSAAVLREPVGIRRTCAVLAGALGAFLILQPGSAEFHWIKLMPVGAGLCYAAMVIVTRRYCRLESPVTLAFGVGVAYVTAAVTGMVVLTLFPPGEAAQAVLPYLARGWLPLTGTLVALALACSVLNVIANLGLTMAYQNAESSWLAPVDYCYLIFATLW